MASWEGHDAGLGSDWETLGPVLPHHKVRGSRTADFVRFAQLQSELKASCGCILEFTRRNFRSLADLAPEFSEVCAVLEQGSETKLCDLASHVRNMESLVQRIHVKEKLRIVFIGPLKAGKSTLINMLLSTTLDEYEMMLPVDNKAATCCIWKVESCSGAKACVFLNQELQEEWNLEGVEAKDIRADIASFLERRFSRDANPLNRGEISVLLPLQLLNPFGCHYSLVDTPGFTESSEYRELVSSFLQDHSHIACMVCPLTEGTALPEETQSMLRLNSYSKTFWVLTRFDMALMLKTGKQRLSKMSNRQVADSLVVKFQKDINSMGNTARVFRHAAGLMLDPDDSINKLLQEHLPLEEAKTWIADIQAHVKECFMAMQQEQTVLSSQAQQAMVRTAELMDVYTDKVKSSQGTVALSDFYAREMETAAEDAAACLEREIKQEVDTLRAKRLSELCHLASQEVLQEGGRIGKVTWVRHSYIERVLALLAPKIEHELEVRLGEAMQRAHEKTLEVALRLLREAGLDGLQGANISSQSEIIRPETDHLRGRYPVESVTMLTGATFLAGRAAATEAGAAVLSSLGVSFTSLQLVGLVSSAIGAIAVLGFTTKYALEVHPFWYYETAQAELIEDIKRTNHWNILTQACIARSRSQLLSNAARFRFKFSELLLTQGASQEALHTLFPDLLLLEKIRAKLAQCCHHVQRFMEADSLTSRAGQDVVSCCSWRIPRMWSKIISQTNVYVGENSRTDTIDGFVLARLLCFRTEALIRMSCFQEASHTIAIFKKTFPALLLPVVYGAAVDVLLSYYEDKRALEPIEAQVCYCTTELEGLEDHEEVPCLVKIWYLAVVSSFSASGDGGGHVKELKLLPEAITCWMQQEMRPPCFESIVKQKVTLVKELSSSLTISQSDSKLQEEEIKKVFQDQCEQFISDLVESVHVLLEALPPEHLSMSRLARSILKHVLGTVKACLELQPEPFPEGAYRNFLSSLCPVDKSSATELSDEWVRQLGALIMEVPQQE